MVGLGRVELPANGLGNHCSIHLSYSPTIKDYYEFTTFENPDALSITAIRRQTCETKRLSAI